MGPGTVFETNGNIRQLEQEQTIEFRSQANKYTELLRTVAEFLGLDMFLQRYLDFYNEILLPKVSSYLSLT